MEKERYSRLYNVHSRSGVILGLFVYLVSFTGCVALFYDEIQTWEDPAKRLNIAKQPATMMPAFSAWVAKKSSNNQITSLRFSYPSHHNPYFSASIETKNADGKKNQNAVRWNSLTGEQLANREHGLSLWIRGVHRQLMWPTWLGGKAVGRALVGVIGLILMLSIITGIVTHTKIIRQMFTLRTKRSELLKWQDLHKVLGLWPLPFHTMIAFTGAFVGIIAIFSPVIAVLAFKGDTEALKSAVLGQQLTPIGIEAVMVSVDDVGKMPYPGNNLQPSRIIFHHWGDKNANYDVQYPVSSELATVNRLRLSGVSAEILNHEPANGVPAANRVINTLTPLHYGNYGDVWLKFLYLILGLILCFVTASGLIIWIERRQQRLKGPSNDALYRRFGKLTIATTLGLPLASIAIFYVDKLYTGVEMHRLVVTGSAYLGVWLAVIVFVGIRSDPNSSIRRLFLLAGALMVFLPLLNYATTGDSFWRNLNNGNSWAWVDLTFLLLGFATLLPGYYLHRRRPQIKSEILEQ